MKTTIAFDVYGTLIDPFGITSSVRDLVGDHAAPFARLWRLKQFEYMFRRGLMGAYKDFSTCTSEALEYTCDSLGVTISDSAKKGLLDRYRELPAYRDVPGVLQQLKIAGLRLFAFSNGQPDDLHDLLAHAGLNVALDGIISVHDIRSFKPDPAVYDHFLEATDSLADRTWLVSGNPFDILGAAARGWRTAWVQRDEKVVFDPWGIEPTATVHGFGELVGILR